VHEAAATPPRPFALIQAVRARWFELGVGACTAGVAAFLVVQLDAWPPHEDETLALFVGREPLDRLLSIVLGERGGAPLHFLLAFGVVHAGGGLLALRLLSAVFAVASLPLIAALGTRLAGRGPALAATALASVSWVLLFHGIYARMYSLFLFLSALSFIALLRALERGGRRAWIGWTAVSLLMVASHPYGALVVAAQGAYVVLTRSRLKEAAIAFAALVVLATPFWRASLVLARRFDVGVGGGGGKLGSPGSVLHYLYGVAGDFTAGWAAATIPVLLLAGIGLTRLRHRLLAVCVVVVPALFFVVGRFSSSTSPESRHLIFVLPFFLTAVACGVVVVARRPLLVAAVVVAFLPLEAAWGWHKTPALFQDEPPSRVAARDAAAHWLASTARRDDVLFGYEPVFLAAWQANRSGFPREVVPRADPKLALSELRKHEPLGRAVFVFDAGDTNNFRQRPTIALRLPFPRRDFEGVAYGPFLVIRTTRPTRTAAGFLEAARKIELIGKSLAIGDADVNYQTVVDAASRLARARPSR
jgi:hypothetical protein